MHSKQLMKYILIKLTTITLIEAYEGLSFSLKLLDPFVYEDNSKCSVANGCFDLQTENVIHGTDHLGDYVGTEYGYLTAKGTRIILVYKDYGQGVEVYTQQFPDGLLGTSNDKRDGVCTSWPTFLLPTETEAPNLRFITPGGYQSGWTLYAQGRMNDTNRFRDGESGGIVILARQGQSYVDSIIMTALIEPMAINVALDRDINVLHWGIEGQAESLPLSYKVEVIVRSDNYSINRNVKKWGEAQKAYHQSIKRQDFTSDYLGYWTDNGAAHYYNPTPYNNFEDALMSVYEESIARDIPIRYAQIDSWWYYKGEGNGLKEWSPRPIIFPNGISPIHINTGWPIVAHNRYFASDTVYAVGNGGSYPFFIDVETSKSLPLTDKFWDDLFDEAKLWGLHTYEQDWLDRQYEDTSLLHTNVTLGSWWLNSMAAAADGRGIPIQYCMAFPRHFLHSITLPTVTQIRVSDDYAITPDQWKIGTTSLFAYSLGLKPYKDTFWTSPINEDVLFNNCEVILPDIESGRFIHQYAGWVNVTESGKDCLYWTDFGYDKRYPHIDLRQNICRNPDGIRNGIFCYIHAGFDIPENEWIWEYCDLPICFVDCYPYDGALYVGGHNITTTGEECVDWDGEFHLHGSMCRNPNRDIAPWCYITEDHSEKEYCDNKCREFEEPNPSLQAAISTLSTGPVGIGDKAVNIDRDLVMKSCRKDGLLLKPSKPLTTIDLSLLSDEPFELWTADSTISSLHFGIIFLAEISSTQTLSFYELNLENALKGDTVLYLNYPNAPVNVTYVPEGTSLTFSTQECNGSYQFCLYYTAPVLKVTDNEIAILGELSKWSPISEQRIKSIEIAQSILLRVSGVKEEIVQMTFWSSKEFLFDITCNFVRDGDMMIDVNGKICV